MEKWAKDMNMIFIKKRNMKGQKHVNQGKENEISSIFKGPIPYIHMKK